MSIRHVARVWEQSGQKGAALLLMLALADSMSDEFGIAWLSIDAQARKARVDRSTVIRLHKSLMGEGELEIDAGAGPGGTHVYRLGPLYRTPGMVPRAAGAEAAIGGSHSETPLARDEADAEAGGSHSETPPAGDEVTAGEPATSTDGGRIARRRAMRPDPVVVKSSSPEEELQQQDPNGSGRIWRPPMRPLEEIGVAAETARELEALYPERVTLWLDIAAWSEHVRDEKLGPGFLVRAIRQNWRPVRGYLPPEERCPECWMALDAYSGDCETHEAASRRRYVEGPYADLIEH